MLGEVSTASVATGVLGVGGNKGAVAIGFTLHRRRLAFLASHFAAHQAWPCSSKTRLWPNTGDSQIRIHPASGSAECHHYGRHRHRTAWSGSCSNALLFAAQARRTPTAFVGQQVTCFVCHASRCRANARCSAEL